MVDFVNLHVHSSIGSMADSMAPVDGLFKRAKELGQTALAISDHGTMAALFDARKASVKCGLKYLPAMEAYFVEDVTSEEKQKRRHLVLIAKNEAGYRNLLKLNYEGYRNRQYVAVMNKIFPRIDWKLLGQYAEGLICLTACSSGLVAKELFKGEDFDGCDVESAEKAVLKLKALFGEDLYLELQPHKLKIYATDRKTGERIMKNDKPVVVVDQHELNLFMIAQGQKHGIKTVATCDVHYLTKEDAKIHDMLMAIGDRKPLSDSTRHRYEVEEFYLKPGELVYEQLQAEYGAKVAAEACASTVEVAGKCADPKYTDSTGPRFPRFPVKDEPDYAQFLTWVQKQGYGEVPEDHAFMRFKTIEAFKAKFPKHTKEQRKVYCDRIQTEIKVLEQHNFCSYMLIVSDFIRAAKANGVRVGPGRGSAAGSLVAFLLDIHAVDPIKYDLLFERFHNKEKKAFPDIDSDFDPEGRDWVEQYIVKKYGQDKVAHVSNLSRMTPKVVIKDLARSLELGGGRSQAFEIANKITDTIPATANTFDEALAQSKEFAVHCQKYPDLEKYGRKLVGLEKTYSTHAAGIVIGDVALDTFVPLRIDKDGITSVQYEKNRCEEMGLIKMDLLGLETLRVISNTIANAKGLNDACPEPEGIDLEDKAVWVDIAKGKTMGVFQMGSPHMVALCKQIKPKCIDDLSLINAIGRPSAAKSRDTYIARRDNREQVTYKYPCLKAAFDDTLGVGVYEEQLMKMGKTIAGWDLNKSDAFRKLSKLKGKDPAFVEKLRKDFVADASKLNGLKESEAMDIWVNIIEPFGGYSFNRSHGVAYSFNGFHTAYYKHYHPAAFMAATLKSEIEGNGADRDHSLREYKKEAKRLGLSVLPPDVNKSGESFDAFDQKTIVSGLKNIKGLGDSAVNNILKVREERAFTSFADFMFRTDSRCVRKDVIQAMAKAGALDCFGITRKSICTYYQDIRAKANKYGNGRIDSGEDACDALNGFEFDRDDFYEEWTLEEKLKYENEVLGEFVSGTINDLYSGFFTGSTPEFSRVKNMPDNHTLRIEAIVADFKEDKIKKAGKNKGKSYARCSVTDTVGESLSMTVWPEQWIKYKGLLVVGAPIKAIVKVSDWNNTKTLVLENLE
jgi:DNA polymerase-3 subunit alpha